MKHSFSILLFALCVLLLPVQSAGQTAHPKASRPEGFDQVSKAADQARTANHDEEAIRLYRQALDLRPDWEEGLWYLATLFYEKERYPEARDILRRFMALQANAGPGWAILGMSEFQCHEYTRALDHLQRAMFLGMGDRKDMVQTVTSTVAELLIRFERYDDSLNLLFRMLGTGTDKSLIIDPVGLAALRMPLLPSEIPPARRELVRLAGEGSFASQTPQFKDADQTFQEMEKKYPNEAGVHFLYGVYLMDLRPDEAVRELKRELEISPSHVPARLRLAEVHIQNQEVDQALALAQEAVKLEPEYPSARLILGEAEIAKGESAEGIKELEVARAKQPATPRVHWDLVRAYTAAGRMEDAKREKEMIEQLSRTNSENNTVPREGFGDPRPH
jgi:tetratricopeptide (TPR) repeat protein